MTSQASRPPNMTAQHQNNERMTRLQDPGQFALLPELQFLAQDPPRQATQLKRDYTTCSRHFTTMIPPAVI